jgi:hypothetical protein
MKWELEQIRALLTLVGHRLAATPAEVRRSAYAQLVHHALDGKLTLDLEAGTMSGQRRRSWRRWLWFSYPRQALGFLQRPASGVGPTRPVRRLLALHDLARIVVVAEPPAPASDGMDRRAPG